MGIGIFAVFAGAGRDGNDILANLVPKQPHFPINFRSLIFIVILKMCVENAPFLGTVLLVLACLTLNWANILTFNFTVICMDPLTSSSNAQQKDSPMDDILPMNTSSSSTPSSSLTSSLSSSSSSHEEGDNLKNDRRRKKRQMFDEDGQQQMWSIPRYSFTSTERSQAMSVVAVGALLANFPVVVLINWHGPRIPFALLGILGAVATAVIPFCLSLGYYWFLAARFVQGVAFAGDMATFGHFLANWTEHKRYAFLTASLALYVQLAPFFTFPAAGLLCNSGFGWPAVYYAHSIVTVLFFILFATFYRNRAFMPANKIHPIGNGPEQKEPMETNGKMNGELAKAEMGNGQIGGTTKGNEMVKARKKMEKKARQNIPYKEILTSKAVWAIFISAVGDFTAVNLLYQFTPIYLHTVQGFDVMETGLMATLPPLVQAIMKECAGLLNDRIPRSRLSASLKSKLFNSIALFSTGGFLFALAATPTGHGYVALGFITAGEAFLGFIVGGFYTSGPQLAGLYGPFVMGQVSTALTLTMLIVPYAVNQLTSGNTIAEWAMAFCLVGIVVCLCNFYYILFAKAKPEFWATLEYYQERKEKEKRKNKLEMSMKAMKNGTTGLNGNANGNYHH